MKQILQNLEDGETWLIAAPDPMPRLGAVLIKSRVSLISSGTERMLVEFGKASLLEKARQQPEKVKAVMDKVRTDGLFTTLDAVKSKLGEALPLGYCHVGVVASGSRSRRFREGQRVVSNGPHADLVQVPENLCVPIPDAVDDDSASFTVVASIGLQGIRLANPTLGEAFVVTGVGLIGLITVQLLRAHGCRVLAIDLDEHKLSLAELFGAETCNPGRGEDPVQAGMNFSRGKGVDGVIITASSKSSELLSQAARMSRKRGRIILVGVAGLNLSRAEFYEKELSFQVSCSYGPGRYDRDFEEGGQDYPFGFVRWTEQRNFEAILDSLKSGLIDVRPLITHRFPFATATSAYKTLLQDKQALGILLEYEGVAEDRIATVSLAGIASAGYRQTAPVVGVIGAGNYASRILIPAFRSSGAQLHTVVSRGGLGAVVQGRKSGFGHASSDNDAVMSSEEINAVVIATRHDTHAALVVEALGRGKHVFVEKPLAMTEDEVVSIRSAYQHAMDRGQSLHLMVGFNRRFSPHVRRMKELLESCVQPKSFIITINSGAIPVGHWTQDPEIGGGRIIGEACHFVDLMRFLAGQPVVSVAARGMGDVPGQQRVDDNAVITLGFDDGSFGSINYLANGAPDFPKERIEVFTGGRVLQLDNFRKLRAYGWPGFRRMDLFKQDKGQAACVAEFVGAVEQGRPTPIPAEELFEVATATIEAANQLSKQC